MTRNFRPPRVIAAFEAVATREGVDIGEVYSRRRTPEIIAARSALCYLLWRRTFWSSTDVAYAVRGRRTAYTSVLDAVKRMEANPDDPAWAWVRDVVEILELEAAPQGKPQ